MRFQRTRPDRAARAQLTGPSAAAHRAGQAGRARVIQENNTPKGQGPRAKVTQKQPSRSADSTPVVAGREEELHMCYAGGSKVVLMKRARSSMLE